MNAELRSMKTNAEQALAEAYAAAKAKLPGDRKVVALREAAVRAASTRSACRTGGSRSGNTPISAR